MFSKLFQNEPWLKQYEKQLIARVAHFEQRHAELVGDGDEDATKLVQFARDAYETYGLHLSVDGTAALYCEWAPSATKLAIVGDFNDWRPRDADYAVRGAGGVWRARIEPPPARGTAWKVLIDDEHYRLSTYATRTRMDAAGTQCEALVDYWRADERAAPPKTPAPAAFDGDSVLIYEVHVGMSGEEPRVHTYDEFRERVLPYVVDAGYTALQVMAVAEHAYYASFGYQVTSFYAPSHRFGDALALRRLVDAAHDAGLYVLLDLVHSHASRNVDDGANRFDGSDNAHYFRGAHPQWDSRLFAYERREVLRFLLGNVAYWLDRFGFDGFRFDGVSSMLYTHHALAPFGSGDDYFAAGQVNLDALTYLALAMQLTHAVRGGRCYCVAEEVTGMPALAVARADGGVGFDARLAMALPDKWIELLKHVRDEAWSMGELVHTLENRPAAVRTVAYAESHDQALVGDKTLAMWLFDAEIYTHMSTLVPSTPRIDRGMALHKMIRALTLALGGAGAYLAFMGNEFGHPEWIDFPRQGNAWSYAHCRRQWRLKDDAALRYSQLGAFDRALIAFARRTRVLAADPAYVTLKHESDKLIVFERAAHLFVFCFHASESFTDYHVPLHTLNCADNAGYRRVLSSDAAAYGGHARLDDAAHVHRVFDRRVSLYIPSRTFQVFEQVSEEE